MRSALRSHGPRTNHSGQLRLDQRLVDRLGSGADPIATSAVFMASNTSSSAAWSKAIVRSCPFVSSWTGLTDSRTVAVYIAGNTTINGPSYTTSRDATRTVAFTT